MASSTAQPIPDSTSAATRIAGYTVIGDSPTASQVATEISQAEHRLELANFWSIPSGSRILEIGCGQGTCTAVLADAVGPKGFIDAVDPGPPDYGTPYTLAQSQAHISQSAVGGYIRWHRSDPVEFLAAQAEETRWDAAVLAHCIWYFDRPEILLQILQSLKGRVKRVLIAEYALQASESRSMPHVLASIARAVKEAHHPMSQANIRCLLSPTQIAEVAETAGWVVEKETIIVPKPALQDGEWESSSVVSEGFLENTEALDLLPRVATLLQGVREAVISSVNQLEKGQSVRTMDVWAATFTSAVTGHYIEHHVVRRIE